MKFTPNDMFAARMRVLLRPVLHNFRAQIHQLLVSNFDEIEHLSDPSQALTEEERDMMVDILMISIIMAFIVDEAIDIGMPAIAFMQMASELATRLPVLPKDRAKPDEGGKPEKPGAA